MSISAQSTDLTEIQQGTALDPDTMAYIERQAWLFDQQRSQLLQQYSEQFVWFEEGQILDADVNEADLVTRVYRNVGLRPVFIEKVLPATPQPSVRTPFPTHPSSL
jgi:hypothetical protein